MTNYGIVGTGYFGADLARSLEKIKDAKVTAVFDPENGEKVSKELNTKNCLSLEELVGLMENMCFVRNQFLYRMKIVRLWLKLVEKIM